MEQIGGWCGRNFFWFSRLITFYTFSCWPNNSRGQAEMSRYLNSQTKTDTTLPVCVSAIATGELVSVREYKNIVAQVIEEIMYTEPGQFNKGFFLTNSKKTLHK